MSHHCHATDCTVAVSPEMFMCKPHWFSLPRELRNALWRAYRPGQCDDMNPSREYCEVAKQCVRFVASNEKRKPDTTLYDLFLRGED